MRILHLIDSLNLGGAETLLMSYVPKLEEHQHTVVTLYGNNVYAKEGYEHIALDFKVPRNLWGAVQAIRKIIRQRNIELIHSHSFWTNILSRLAAPSYIPVLNHYHFADYDTFKEKRSVKIMIALDKVIFHRKLVRVAVSGYVKLILKQIFVRKTVEMLPNFIDCKQPLLAKKQTTNVLRIVSIGNVNIEKNHEVVIEAFTKLKDLPVCIDIIGGGADLDILKEEARIRDVSVNFRGYVVNAAQELRHYDVFLSASISETFGIAVLEGVCAGLPLILSDIPPFREIAPAGTLYFNPHSAQDLADKIRFYLQKEIQIDKEQYQAVLDEYSMEKYLSGIRGLYQSLDSRNLAAGS